MLVDLKVPNQRRRQQPATLFSAELEPNVIEDIGGLGFMHAVRSPSYYGSY